MVVGAAVRVFDLLSSNGCSTIVRSTHACSARRGTRTGAATTGPTHKGTGRARIVRRTGGGAAPAEGERRRAEIDAT